MGEDCAHHFFEVDEEVVKSDKVKFGFDVGVFRQVAAGERFLGAEGGRNAEDVTEGGNACFEVELRGLGQVGFFAVVVECEEGGAAFHLGLDHAGGGYFQAAWGELVVGFAESAEEGCADFHY